MEITKRQGEILNGTVKDYINLAQPISSEFLEKKHNFGISPATIRIEMQKLTDLDYLTQPHTSAGRVPTDKGYRFYVDSLLKEREINFGRNKFFKEIYQTGKEIKDSLKLTKILTKKIAKFTSNLIISYFPEDEVIFTEGWGEVFEEPEFESLDFVKDFTEMVENFEEDIKTFTIKNNELRIFIGEENPFSKLNDFSLIISKSKFPKNKKGTLALLGPKRMDYDRNIGIINSLTKLMTEI